MILDVSKTEKISTKRLDEIMDLAINTLVKHEKVKSNALFHIRLIQKREKMIHSSRTLVYDYFRAGSINHNLARIIYLLAVSRTKEKEVIQT